jgi:hypothetical protein
MPVSTITHTAHGANTAEQLKERVANLKLTANGDSDVKSQKTIVKEVNSDSEDDNVKVVDPFNYVVGFKAPNFRAERAFLVCQLEPLSNPTDHQGETFGQGPGADYPYPDFLREFTSFCGLGQLDLCPAHNPTRTQSDPPLPMFDIVDRGHRADPDCARLRAFVEARGGKVKDLGISSGAVVEGNVKLEELGEEEKDDL